MQAARRPRAPDGSLRRMGGDRQRQRG
ncbi:hypothetical protein ACH4OI_03660 [Streptomyces luteogriseus]